MAAAEKRIKELQKEVAQWKLRAKEFGDENNDLRELCNRKNIQYEEWLAACRHGRYFAQLCADHSIEITASASELADPSMQKIAEYTGSVLCVAMIARSFFSACAQLTAAFPWRFGGRMMTSLEAHRARVWSLAVLEGGRLASGSYDRTIKTWDWALPDVLH